MAEDAQHYSFDLTREVGALRNELGNLAKGILFAKADIRKNGRFISLLTGLAFSADIEAVDGQPQASTRAGERALERAWIKYFKDPGYSSHMKPYSTFSTVVVRGEEKFFSAFGEQNKDMTKLFILYHETGHALNTAAREIDRECAADAYAALRLLQRFGANAVPLLSMISWKRTLDTLETGNVNHLTTTVLDRIILDAKKWDFSQLDTYKTMELAAAYANAESPSPKALSAVAEMSRQPKKKSILELMSATCLSSAAAENDFAFYISAKLAMPFLMLKNIAQDDAHWRSHTTDNKAKLEKVKSAIVTRLENLQVTDIFNENAPKLPPLAGKPLDALRVLLPKGQNQFAFFQEATA